MTPGSFNVTDAQVAAAVQLFNLAAIRHYQALSQGETASRYALQRAENDVATAVARLYVLAQRASTQIASRQADVALFERLLKVAQDEFTGRYARNPHYWQEVRSKIAAVTKAPVNTVATRIFKARALLARLFGAPADGEEIRSRGQLSR